jgi:hypothetical protein
VQVNVVALDKSGRPVPDLTAADFTLNDDGQAQKISIFSVEDTRATSPLSQQLPPNTFSNRWEDRARAPRSVSVRTQLTF